MGNKCTISHVVLNITANKNECDPVVIETKYIDHAKNTTGDFQ